MSLQTAGAPITADRINRQYTLADASNTTVTAAAATNLCTAYTIAGSDASQFTTYRLTAWGSGTWGSTQQKLTVNMALAGTLIGTAPALVSTSFAASAAFNWRLIMELMCTATGTSGTWSASLSGIFTQTANPIQLGTAADNSVPLAGITAADVTRDTTIASSVAIQAAWGATTGAPTITCVNTMFERLAV